MILMHTQKCEIFTIEISTYSVDDDGLPLPSVNVVEPIARPFPAAVAVDRVRVVTFSTICVLDFQQYEGNHCKPVAIN